MANTGLICLFLTSWFVICICTPVQTDHHTYPTDYQKDAGKADPPKEYANETITEKPPPEVKTDDAIYPLGLNSTKRAFRRDEKYKWKIMNIYIEPSHFSEDEVKLINQASSVLYKILSPCGVHIGIWPPGKLPEGDYVRVVNEMGKGCSSKVGRIGGEQKLNLETSVSSTTSCVNKKTILHELLHALGFEHEHKRIDRDEHIEILWENIPEEKKHNFDKREDDDTLGLPYNENSIMHYGDTSFASRPGLKTMKSKHGKTLGWKGDPQNPLMGDDVEMIKRAYCNGGSQSPAISKWTMEKFKMGSDPCHYGP